MGTNPANDDTATNPPGRSLLELEGLGAEVWREVLGDRDAAEYINEERDSWR